MAVVVGKQQQDPFHDPSPTLPSSTSSSTLENNLYAASSSSLSSVVLSGKVDQTVFLEEDKKFNPVDAKKREDQFRNYVNGPRQKRVQKFYYDNHTKQTLEFVQGLHRDMKFDKMKLTVWEGFEKLSEVIDDSDPDTNFSQLVHGLQTAEALRKEFPQHDWLHLIGLIHDLGKVLTQPCFELEQWAIVGDTFPVGCQHSDKIVFHEYFAENPDSKNEVYSSENGIYEAGCGLMNLQMSFGHDEYLYQVLKHNNSKIPIEGLYVLRFHSFYAWHRGGAYQNLTNSFDAEMYPWVKAFNRSDLYSKSHEPPKVEVLREYYQQLIDKYIPGVLNW
jgi:inositol oxygenase